MVLYYLGHSQNQRGMVAHRPIYEKGRASKARTTALTRTSGRAS
jgi:hypothetical protein